MTISDWITLGATVVTIGATIFTVVQAKDARKASADAEAAVAKVRLAANADRLRSAQEHIRSLPSLQEALRGSKPERLIASIRQEFDITLGVLPKTGSGAQARELLVIAQSSLNKYEASLPTEIDRDAWQTLQSSVQDAISDLTTPALPGETS